MHAADEKPGEPAAKEVRFRDAASAIEFVCWVVVALAPFLRWVNGQAVTTDQFVIQVTMVSVAFIGASALRIYSWRQRRPR